MAKVLVVDDEDVLVEMVAMLVEDLGHQSITAANGREALNVLSDHLNGGNSLPALIITDVMMPKMNGVDFTKSIRADAHLKKIPVIMMSAAGCPIDGHMADYFINKPFDLDDLANLIEKVVNSRQVA